MNKNRPVSPSHKVLCFAIPSLQAGGMERVMSEISLHISAKKEVKLHLILYGIDRGIFYEAVTNEILDDEQTLASYFDIICRFTKREFKESLKFLTLDSFIFFFYTHTSQYHLVLKCDNEDIDTSKLEEVSETIIESFLKKHEEDLKAFNGEISHFKSFSKDIMHILDSKFESLFA